MAGTVVVAAKTDDLAVVVVVTQEVMRHYMALELIACAHASVSQSNLNINRLTLHWLVTWLTVRYLWSVLLAKHRVLSPTSNNHNSFKLVIYRESVGDLHAKSSHKIMLSLENVAKI